MILFVKLAYFSTVGGLGDSLICHQYTTALFTIPVVIMAHWFTKAGRARAQL
jgi:hypothetical protein